ncbi:hypothetical protein MAFF212519_11570 [Clavibacter michiganensis]
MPNVRASSGMIGTTRLPKSFERMRSFRSRTNAMVVAISCVPEPFFEMRYAESSGSVMAVCCVRRSGEYPPSARRRSCMYWMASSSWPGW